MIKKAALTLLMGALALPGAVSTAAFLSSEASAAGYDRDGNPRKKTYTNNSFFGDSGDRGFRRDDDDRYDYRRNGGFFDFFNTTRIRNEGISPRRPPAGPPPVKVYVADKLVSLVDGSLEQPTGRPLDDSLAQTVYQTLRNGGSGVRLTKPQKTAVIKFYKKRRFAPVWTQIEGVDSKAKWVLETLNKAGKEGLDPHDYKLSVITEAGGQFDNIESDLSAIAAFDVQLTAMALRYADHAYGGRIDPNRLTSYHDLKTNQLDLDDALAKLAESGTPDEYLQTLHPIHPAYAKFKQALDDLGGSGSAEYETPIPSGHMIRPGQQDSRLVEIRNRLEKLGHYSPSEQENTLTREDDDGTVLSISMEDNSSEIYDEELVRAVRKFQKNSGLRPDAIIGPATLRAFNNRGGGNLQQKLIYNMERLRWLPRNLGKRHVFVNQPAFELKMFNNGARIWKTRVIVGKPRHQTSFFSDEMERVVFNPYWGVPQSIITNEFIPSLLRNRYYLERGNYEVTDLRGRHIRSTRINWYQYAGLRQVPFNIRQRPGRGNALGEIKFLFPNKHAIYFHDTPTRNLFKKDARAFSHGCVRVQDPRKFAEHILGWERDRIDDAVAAGENRKVELKKIIPVHLTYFTAWPGDDGGISYYKDMYSRDRLIEKAFNTTQIALR